MEGGLKEWWKLLGKNSPQITLLLTVLAIYLSQHPTENKELVKLQIENLKLDNEIKQNELKKISKEIKSEDEVTDELVYRVLEKLNNDYKLLWYKSNFYRKLNLYLKVNKISTQKLDENNKPIGNERIISRNEFSKFIIHSNKFPPNIDEEALIDIISPVLIKGNFQWKGFYNGEIIGFEMKDNDFKNAVLNKQIEFINGTAIKCYLQQNRKIDEVGKIQIVNNQVYTVFEILSGNKIIETEQGKKQIKIKKLNESQLTFNLE
ncbi:MAG: hypothetical protein H7Y10_08515 [Flavobacterium sp.]|nr:hypothetical protein [Flavobacterium sp.]